jgi:hypothetical protein
MKSPALSCAPSRASLAILVRLTFRLVDAERSR